MTFFTHAQTADEATALIADLAGADLLPLEALARHLGSAHLCLDPERKEVWWVAPDREVWAVESTTPGRCLDLISDRADPAWASELLARAEYQCILDALLPATQMDTHGVGGRVRMLDRVKAF